MSNRITVNTIAEALERDNPGLFRAVKGLKLVTDWNPDEQVNTEGVYVSRPVVVTDLQIATVDRKATVYDETCQFDILMLSTRTNQNFEAARIAIENLTEIDEFDCFYSKSLDADETYNGSYLQVEFNFTLQRTVTKTKKEH